MMKRSRRSLGLLLASMALWLMVLRATTLSGGNAPNSSRQRAAAPSVSEVPPAAASKPAGEQPAPQFAPVVEPEGVVFTSHAVSMTAFVIVLPHAPAAEDAIRQVDEGQSFDSARRTGWSGCMAFANGFDHLGRACVARRPETRPDAPLLFGALKRILRQAAGAASASVDVVCLAASASERAPSLAKDWARSRAER